MDSPNLHECFFLIQTHLSAHLTSIQTTSSPLGHEGHDIDIHGYIDDVLLRQKLWAEDININGGVLRKVEAKDKFASSVIRLYLNDIVSLLSEIDR